MPSLCIRKKFTPSYIVFMSKILFGRLVLLLLCYWWSEVLNPNFDFFSTLCTLLLDWRQLVIIAYQLQRSWRGCVNAPRSSFNHVLLSVKRKRGISVGWGRAGICTKEGWSQCSPVFQFRSISPIWKATVNEFACNCDSNAIKSSYSSTPGWGNARKISLLTLSSGTNEDLVAVVVFFSYTLFFFFLISFFLVSLAKCLSILLIFLRTYIPAGERVITKWLEKVISSV